METKLLRWLMNEYVHIRFKGDLGESISYPGLSEVGCELLFKLGELFYESDFLDQLGFDFLLSGEASLFPYIKSRVQDKQSFHGTYHSVRRSILKAAALLSEILSGDPDNYSNIDLELRLISANALRYCGLPALDRIYIYPFSIVKPSKSPVEKVRAKQLLRMLSSLSYEYLFLKVNQIPEEYAAYFKYIYETSDEFLTEEDLELKQMLRHDVEDVVNAKQSVRNAANRSVAVTSTLD